MELAMKRYAGVALVALGLAMSAGHAQATGFFEQALKDTANGATVVWNGVGHAIQGGPGQQQTAPPTRQNPCTLSGGNACDNHGSLNQ